MEKSHMQFNNFNGLYGSNILYLYMDNISHIVTKNGFERKLQLKGASKNFSQNFIIILNLMQYQATLVHILLDLKCG